MFLLIHPPSDPQAVAWRNYRNLLLKQRLQSEEEEREQEREQEETRLRKEARAARKAREEQRQ